MPLTLKQRVDLCRARMPSVTNSDLAAAADIKLPSVFDWFKGETRGHDFGCVRHAS